MESYLLDELHKLDSEIKEREIKKSHLRLSVGMKQLDEVYSTFIKSYKQKLIHDEQIIVDNELNRPYITFTVNEIKYGVIFDFLKDYKLGEYFEIDNLKILNSEENNKLLNDVDKLETIFLLNTQLMYEQLPNVRKQTHSEFKRVFFSKKRRYTYHYSGSAYRQFTMGFIIVPVK